MLNTMQHVLRPSDISSYDGDAILGNLGETVRERHYKTVMHLLPQDIKRINRSNKMVANVIKNIKG